MPWIKADYPENWDEIRARILERDGHACARCGVKNYSFCKRLPDGGLLVFGQADSYRQAQGFVKAGKAQDPGKKYIIIVLTVSHSCHDPKCEDESHLSALCQYHHLMADRSHHARNARATWRRKKFAGQAELFPE